jgi:hypothetical protein
MRRATVSGRRILPITAISCPSREWFQAGCASGLHQGFYSPVGSGSFELRVYAGTEPNSGRGRCVTRTVRCDRGDALRELEAPAATANIVPAVGTRTPRSLSSSISGSPGGWTGLVAHYGSAISALSSSVTSNHGGVTTSRKGTSQQPSSSSSMSASAPVRYCNPLTVSTVGRGLGGNRSVAEVVAMRYFRGRDGPTTRTRGSSAASVCRRGFHWRGE